MHRSQVARAPGIERLLGGARPSRVFADGERSHARDQGTGALPFAAQCSDGGRVTQQECDLSNRPHAFDVFQCDFEERLGTRQLTALRQGASEVASGRRQEVRGVARFGRRRHGVLGRLQASDRIDLPQAEAEAHQQLGAKISRGRAQLLLGQMLETAPQDGDGSLELPQSEAIDRSPCHGEPCLTQPIA